MKAELRRRQQRPRVSANSIESDITEVEQARKTDHNIQSEGEHRVDQCEIDDAYPGAANAVVDDERQHRKPNCDQRISDPDGTAVTLEM